MLIGALLLSFSLPLYAQDGGETEEEERLRLINNLMVGANNAFTESNLTVAKGELTKLIKMDPQFAPAFFLMTKIDVRAKDYDSAADNIRKSIQLDPENDKYRKELTNIIGLNYNEGNLEFK